MPIAAPRLLAVAAVLFLAGTDLRAQPVQSPGTIDAVTVYRGQALVTRLVEIPGPAGLREVVVTGLPDFILPASLYAEPAEGVEVRSVLYRVRPVSEDEREGVRKLEEQIRAERDALDSARGLKAVNERNGQMNDKIEQFLAATGTVEMGKGVLNAETISKLAEFLSTSRKAAYAEGQKLALEIRAHEEKLSLLEREMANVSAKTSRTAREAVVFVNLTGGKGLVRLNYLVDRAGWSPSYNLRAETAPGNAAQAPQVNVEYQASIQQMSGEDWANVTMTLSTATPALVASGPRLTPLAVALAGPLGGSGGQAEQLVLLKDKGYFQAKKELGEKQREIVVNRNIAQPAQQMQSGFEESRPGGTLGINATALADADTWRADQGLNDVAGQGQILDLLANERVERDRSKRSVFSADAESVSVTYHIPGRASLPSRADQQLVQIAQMPMAAAFTKTATPVLTAFVYNDATVTNTSDMVLLAGPAACYWGGEFVGRGSVPTVAAGETFPAGFGIDSSLRAARELTDRTESIQGGNRVVEFTYRIVIENFAKSPAAVRLIDRVPSPKGPEIKLTMVSTGQDLSKDALYEQNEKKTGILRWDLSVPAGAKGATAMSLEYKFKVEYDKQMSIGVAPAAK